MSKTQNDINTSSREITVEEAQNVSGGAFYTTIFFTEPVSHTANLSPILTTPITVN